MSPEKWPLKSAFFGDMLIFEDGIRYYHFSIFVLKGKTTWPSLFQSRSQNPVWNQCSPPQSMNQQAPFFSKNQRYQQQTTPLVEYSIHDSKRLSFKISGPPQNGAANAKTWPIVCVFFGYSNIDKLATIAWGLRQNPGFFGAFNQSSCIFAMARGPPVWEIFTDSTEWICCWPAGFKL